MEFVELVAVLAIAIGLVVLLIRAGAASRSANRGPELILKERFARGEITGPELEEGLRQLR